MPVVRIAGAIVAGVVLFIAFSLGEGVRVEVVRGGPAESVFMAIALVVLAAVIGFALAIRAVPSFGFVMAGAMLFCAVLGLFTYTIQIAAVAPAEVFDMSTLLTRGASSLSTWVFVCGLIIVAIHRARDRGRSPHRDAADVESGVPMNLQGDRH